MKFSIRIVALLALVILTFSATACAPPSMDDIDFSNVKLENCKYSSDVTDHVLLNVTYTNAKGELATGNIVIRLYKDVAPLTVENFQGLVKNGFYDGLTFHRVYSGFMIQGGDPNGNGSGGSGYPIQGEFSENGIENNLLHVRGVVSMARAQSPNSASSQFFIMHQKTTSLDGNYASFGYVVYGMDTVDGIAGTACKTNTAGEKSSPINPVTINFAKFVTVEENAANEITEVPPYTPPTMESLDFSPVKLENCKYSTNVTDHVLLNVTYTNSEGVECTGNIIIRLYEEVAPITVENFQGLVKKSFFDNVPFHRVYKDFMIQGGDPDGDGISNGNETTIKGEFTSNGFPNNLLHNRGVVSMARTNDPNSASSQFFIMHQKTESLDGKYASFGYVVYGMDTVDGIAGTECRSNSAGEKSSPVNPVTINFAKFVTVEENAVNEITE